MRVAKITKTGASGGFSGPLASVHTLRIHNIPGTFVGSVVNATALSTVAGAANRLDFYPFIPSEDITINELALEVTTLIAGSLARIGLYDSLSNSLPGQLLTGQGTELNCATTGVKQNTITPIKLLGGKVYWVAVLTSSTQTVRGIPVAAMVPLGIAPTGGTQYTLRRATNTYASGLPVLAPATALTSAVAPFVRMQVA